MKCEYCGEKVAKKDIQEHVFFHGIDARGDWIVCSIHKLINEGMLPENSNVLIFEAENNMTKEEFEMYMYDEEYE